VRIGERDPGEGDLVRSGERDLVRMRKRSLKNVRSQWKSFILIRSPLIEQRRIRGGGGGFREQDSLTIKIFEYERSWL
jgi:hypothetical protein